MERELWKRVESLFLACADLPADELANFLAENCADEPALRQEVERMLRADQAPDVMEDAIGTAASGFLNESHELWLGTEIGPYTIEELVAEGGMGMVFKARRSDRHFEQEVAIKILPRDLGISSKKERFLAERQILASLVHENIARLLDGGETRDGLTYLVMEFIEGVPIDVYCDEHHLSLSQRLDMFVRVCEAVRFAHMHLVIHRDIKPGNILVAAPGVPKLLDFGIAKLLDEHELPVADPVQTQAGARFLSPRYASPEQVQGEDVSAASDVYSLGLLLHELLSGGFPYSLENKKLREIEKTIVSDPPLAPSQCVGEDEDAVKTAGFRGERRGSLVHRLRGDLDTIVLKALRKEPEERYASPGEMIQDIMRYRSGLPILARRPSLFYISSRFVRRNRAAAIGVIATFLAVCIGTVLSTIGFINAQKARVVAEVQAENAQAITGFMVSLFDASDPNHSAGKETSASELLAFGLARVDSELGGRPQVHALALESLADVQKSRAEYPEALDLQTRALELYRAGVPGELAILSRMLSKKGDLHRLLDQHVDARRDLDESLYLYEESGLPPAIQQADAMNNLSLVLEQTAEFEQAEKLMRETLQLRQQLLKPPHADIALSYYNLAWLLNRRDRNDEAIVFARKAVEMRIAVWGEVHPRVASARSMLSRIHFSKNEWNQAESQAAQALAIAEQIYDHGHPDLSFPLYELAMVQYERGHLHEASESLKTVSEWERESLGPQSYDYGMSSKAYAATLVDLARYSEAESLLEVARDIFEPLPSAADRARFHTATLLGRIQTATGRYEAAEEMFSDRRVEIENPEFSRRLVVDRALAMVELQLETSKPAEAGELLLPVLTRLQQLPIESRPLWAKTLYFQGRIQLAQGEVEAAIASFDEALGIFHHRWEAWYWHAALTSAWRSEALFRQGNIEEAVEGLLSAVPQLQNTLGTDHPVSNHWLTRLAEISTFSR